jgi:hypothetical protein
MLRRADRSRYRAALAVFLGVLTVGFSLVAVMLPALDPVVRVVLLILAGACIASMFAMYLYDPGSGPSIVADVSGFPPKSSLTILPRELTPPKREAMPVAPTIREKPDAALQNPSLAAVLKEFYTILETPDSDRYQRGVEHLAAHPEALAKSWKALANFARCLALLGRFDSAREHAETLLHLHAATPEAVASYHDLMILCVAATTPNTEGGLRETLLRERLYHVEEGLRALPTHMSLLLNGFETSMGLSDYARALRFLSDAAKVDKESAASRIQRVIDAHPAIVAEIQRDERVQTMLSELGVRTSSTSNQGR